MVKQKPLLADDALDATTLIQSSPSTASAIAQTVPQRILQTRKVDIVIAIATVPDLQHRRQRDHHIATIDAAHQNNKAVLHALDLARVGLESHVLDVDALRTRVSASFPRLGSPGRDLSGQRLTIACRKLQPLLRRQ